MQEQNLWTLFRTVAMAVPERDAIVQGDRRVTYSQLADRASRLSNVFRAWGLGCHRPRSELAGWETGQDLVGVMLLNGAEYLETVLGGLAARVAPFNVNYRYVAAELADLLNDADAAALVYHERFAPIVAPTLPLLKRRPLLLQVADGSGSELLPGALDYEQAVASASDVAAEDQQPEDLYVVYTGGTTGMPKGTLWRQHDIWVAALGGRAYAPAFATDAVVANACARRPAPVLPNAPFMHGAGQWIALGGLVDGGTVVINGVVDRLDPADVWTTIERERVGTTLLIGEAFARPLVEELEAGSYDVSSLQTILASGAFTSVEVKQRLLRQLRQATIVDLAGSSESGGVMSSITTVDAVAEHGVFAPRPEAAVLDVELGRRLHPGENAIGWLAKTGSIPLGYLGDEKKSRATFRTIDKQRWTILGDRARLRSDGSIELLGRDMVTINSGGEKIFAEEVETAMIRHPAVQDVVVVGRPSFRWGQEVVAVVSLAPGSSVTDAELIAAASQRIARYKLPKAVVRVRRVLRGPNGKADYSWAREIALGDPPAGHVSSVHSDDVTTR